MKSQTWVRAVVTNHRDGELEVSFEARDSMGFWFALDANVAGWEEWPWEVTNLAHTATKAYDAWGMCER